MINRVCFKCGEYVENVWVFVISDDREKVELSGHKKCVDNLETQYKAIKNVHKLSVQKVLKELRL
jgi:hypothetical protein